MSRSLDASIQAATEHLFAFKRNQHYPSPGIMAPALAASTLTTLVWFDACPAELRTQVGNTLATRQHADGGFSLNPADGVSDLMSTGACLAGLISSGRGEDDGPVKKARAYLEAHGGMDAVVAGSAHDWMTSTLFMVLAGLLDAEVLAKPPMLVGLFPTVQKLMEKRINYAVIVGGIQMGAIARYLSGDWGEQGRNRHLTARLECDRGIELTRAFQNPQGSWDSNLLQTVTSMIALRAMGVPDTDPAIQTAVHWLCAKSHVFPHAKDHASFRAFGSGSWSTGLCVRALLRAGVSPTDPHVAEPLAWLCKVSEKSAQLPVDNPAGPLRGGLGAEGPNLLLPDADDTAFACAALALAAHPDEDDPITQGRERCFTWLRGMQDSGGGWSDFAQGMPGKKPGALFETPLNMSYTSFLASIETMWEEGTELGDPPVADVTARVLLAFGSHDIDVEDSATLRGVEFLRRQQDPTLHAWWGRWIVNYLSGTSYALMGLASIGADLEAPWIRAALAFVLERQNQDGGWGESIASYSDRSQAGVGPSMPALTGLVITGLLYAGQTESEAVKRGVAYLLDQQTDNGGWHYDGWLHVYAPPTVFYMLESAQRAYPLEALGLYRSLRKGETVRGLRPTRVVRPSIDAPSDLRDAKGAWSPAELRQLRDRSDGTADAVVRALFASGGRPRLNRVFETLVHNDDPVPADMDPAVVAYFTDTAVLPDWVEPAKLELAQSLFERLGWAVAAVLYCSSLPQAYCAANGARVLLGTGGMSAHTNRRILETAQFVFDTQSPGAFAPSGRAVRAAQKVRLLHATIRALTLRSPTWDTEAWGVPINPEDELGTLMTFSVVVTDGLLALGHEVSAAEQEAWLHAWCVVGSLLGIPRTMHPTGVSDAQALMQAIRDDQWAASSQGAELAAALVDSMARYMPGPWGHRLPVAMIRKLAGPRAASLLSLPDSKMADTSVRIWSTLTAVKERIASSRRHSISNYLAFEMMKGTVLAERVGKQTRFRIPPALNHSWNLGD